MAMTVCPECSGKISDKAMACPACGYPLKPLQPRSAWAETIGGVANTYISAKAVVLMVVGITMFIAFAAIMIALIVGT